ncbi:MAG TPA: exo-alpha-sialidase [Ignavibacteriaceae bacterium]|nr:exo-alpha-sialidase [Ignavibacteriaceae bacterium]
MKSRFHKVLFVLFTLLVVSPISFGQFTDPRMWSTQIQPTGEYFQIPITHLKYIHPNKSPRVFDTPFGSVTVGISTRVHPSNFTQSEVPIQRSPLDENTMFASSNAVRISPFFISEGVYVTTDGGATWHGSDTCKTTPVTGHGGDPAPAIGPDGRFYMTFLDGGFNGLKAAYSTNGGTSWSSVTTIITGGQDKNHTVVDNRPGSPFNGRVYASWSRFTAASPPIAISYSTNGGVSWSSAQNINTPPSGHYSQGVNGAIGPNGEVYMVWQNPISSGNFTGDQMGFGKSTDGGVTWSVNNNIYDCNGIRGFLFNTSIRVNDFPWMGVDTTSGIRSGWIYVVHAEKNLAPAGSDPDIIMHRSTDGGTTWSAGIRVNQDAPNNGAEQYMPALVVGRDGSVNVVYYDARNLTNDSASVYVARSVDGGDSWTEFEVSDHHFKPKSIPGLAGGYQGDYIGITETNGKLYPYWADDKTGIYQAWVAEVSFGPGCEVDPPTNPVPANGSSDVSVNLAEISWTNGANALNNDLYFGTNPGNLPLVQSGSLSTNWTIPDTLEYSTTYYWQVVENGATCTTTGPFWSFQTESDPNINLSFEDNFDTYTAGQQVACQNPVDWTTWNFTPCDPVTDAFVSTTQKFSAPNSAVIVDDNDLVYAIPDYTTGKFSVSFQMYVQSGFDAYWNCLQHFDGANSVWGFEAYFDGGAGYISAEQNPQAATFSYPFNTWFSNELIVDLDIDQAEYKVNGVSVHTWQWSPGIPNSGGLNQLGGVDLYGYGLLSSGQSRYYVDDFKLTDLLAVPVELTSFTANSNSLGEVVLNWTTATETNNKGFDVERMIDGKFVKVGYVPGFGTTTEPRNYSYTDSKLSQGKHTYRLKQVDFNGTFEYSNQVEIEVSAPVKFALEQNYPNPFNPSTVISYSLPQKELVTIKVIDILGREVATLVNEIKPAGKFEVEFDASSLASGVYVYQIKAGAFATSKKMLLTK